MNFRAVKFFLCAVLLGVLVARIPATREFILHPLDTRPVAMVLFIGDSRTEQNHMPAMVEAIADSAHSARKYKITMYTPNGSSMQDNWNDPKVHALLEKKWDYVVLQGNSGEQLTQEGNSSFETYGRALTTLAQSAGSAVVLFVGWRYADDDPLYVQQPALRTQMQYMIQDSYGQLALKAGAQIVNVGKAWEELHARVPQMPLYQDSARPSIYGSYLTALMFYRFFSGDNLKNVAYVPEGISDKDAGLIKKFVQEQ